MLQYYTCMQYTVIHKTMHTQLEMWANAQRDGRPAEYVAPSVQRCKVWLTLATRCRAVTLPRRETR